MFDKNRPGGGARGGPCEKSGLEVVIWHPRIVCVQNVAKVPECKSVT